MAYTITDLAELVEYHLVACAPDDEVAHANLVQLVQKVELRAPRPLARGDVGVLRSLRNLGRYRPDPPRRPPLRRGWRLSLRRLLGGGGVTPSHQPPREKCGG